MFLGGRLNRQQKLYIFLCISMLSFQFLREYFLCFLQSIFLSIGQGQPLFIHIIFIMQFNQVYFSIQNMTQNNITITNKDPQQYERQTLITRYLEKQFSFNDHAHNQRSGLDHGRVKQINKKQSNRSFQGKKSKSMHVLRMKIHLKLQFKPVVYHQTSNASRLAKLTKKHTSHQNGRLNTIAQSSMIKTRSKVSHVKTLRDDFDRQKSKAMHIKSTRYKTMRSMSTDKSSHLHPARSTSYSRYNLSLLPILSKSDQLNKYLHSLKRVDEELEGFPFDNKEIKRRVQDSTTLKLKNRGLMNEPLLLIQYKQIFDYRHRIRRNPYKIHQH